MMKSQPSILEITVVSAQGLKNASSTPFFSGPPRPFVTVTTATPAADGSRHVYSTGVDEEGGANPTWGDTLRIPLDPTFFVPWPTSGLFLQLFSKRALLARGPAHLGWCLVPSSDILDGPPSAVGQIRNLSYRVQAKDGSRGEGVVNVAVRLMGPFPGLGRPERSLAFGGARVADPDPGRTAIGIPVTMCPTTSNDRPPYV